MTRTLYDKLVDAHKVCDLPDGDMLIYVDFHIMNEYTSPQAFSGLESKRLNVWRPEAHLSVVDHVNATRSVEAHDAHLSAAVHGSRERASHRRRREREAVAHAARGVHRRRVSVPNPNHEDVQPDELVRGHQGVVRERRAQGEQGCVYLHGRRGEGRVVFGVHQPAPDDWRGRGFVPEGGSGRARERLETGDEESRARARGHAG